MFWHTIITLILNGYKNNRWLFFLYSPSPCDGGYLGDRHFMEMIYYRYLLNKFLMNLISKVISVENEETNQHMLMKRYIFNKIDWQNMLLFLSADRHLMKWHKQKLPLKRFPHLNIRPTVSEPYGRSRF